MSKTGKIIVLGIVLAVGMIGYIFFSEEKKRKQNSMLQEFNRELSIWEDKIRRATIGELTGGAWDGFFKPEGPGREKALSEVRDAALWQMHLHMRDLIPNGYDIRERPGGGLDFVKIPLF